MIDTSDFYHYFGVVSPTITDLVTNHPEQTGIIKPNPVSNFIIVMVAGGIAGGIVKGIMGRIASTGINAARPVVKKLAEKAAKSSIGKKFRINLQLFGGKGEHLYPRVIKALKLSPSQIHQFKQAVHSAKRAMGRGGADNFNYEDLLDIALSIKSNFK